MTLFTTQSIYIPLISSESDTLTATKMVVPAPMIVEDTASAPPRKRLRQEESTKSTEKTKTTREPRLFVPFRALGLITNHIPFVLQTRSHKGATDGPRIHLLTCLGKSWALWEGGKMGLLFVGMYVTEMSGDHFFCI